MRPFKLFFGIAIGIILFFFVARVLFIAFIAAAIMSIVYAIFRRVRDFITYDRYGDYYIQGYDSMPRMANQWNNGVEPLFHDHFPRRRSMAKNIQFIEAI